MVRQEDLIPTVRSPLRGLPIEDQTLPALLQRQASTYDDKVLLKAGAVELTFIEVRDCARAAAAALANAGVEAGDRVVLISANRLELLQFVLGCAWHGAIAVPLNTALRGAQLQHALSNSAPRLIIVEKDLAWLVAPAEVPCELRQVWILGGTTDELAGLTSVSVGAAPKLDAASAAADSTVDPATTAAILYTSGTTGPAKGVCCPQAQFYWWGVIMGELLELSEDDVLYTCLPLFHTNALNAFVQALIAGATFVVGERFSASRFWTRLAEHGATVTYLLGAMVNILCAQAPSPADRAHSVRRALAPATPASLTGVVRDRFGIQLLEGYGSTETNAVIGARLAHQQPGQMGIVLPDFEADVVGDYDVPVPDGTAGELVMRPRRPFSFATGYFRMSEATVAAWQNGWFHSGDRVVRSTDGWIRFLDRTKDAIRRRGENISSFEVEQAILGHPDVAAVAVFAVPSEMAEDEVMAAIMPEQSAEIDPVALTRYCETRLAYFAIPRYLAVVDELPVTENGKVRKAVLRERGVTATTWDREEAGYQVRRDARATT